MDEREPINDPTGPDLLGLRGPVQPDGNERDDSGLTMRQAQILETMAARRGWNKQRYPTRATAEELDEIKKVRPLDAVEKLVRNAHRGLDSPFEKISQAAGGQVLAMEGQNQRDEHRELDAERPVTPGAVVGVNVNVGPGQDPREQLLHDPEYLDWVRQRALEEDNLACGLRADGQPWPVEDGGSPDVP